MRKKTLFSVICLFLLLAAVATASERGAFPQIGIGARPLAMGGAYVAVAEGNEASWWNPAGLSQVKNMQLGAMQTSLFGMAIPYQWLSAALPVDKYAVGLSYTGLDASAAFGDFPYREQSFAATAAGELTVGGHLLKAGVNLKYNTLVGGTEATGTDEKGIGLDVGILWQSYPFSAGVAVRDLYTKLSGTLSVDGEEEPTETHLAPSLVVGAAYRAGKTLWAVDVSELATSPKVHIGVEYQVNNAISVRGGYTGGSFSGGIGIRSGSWSFDYAYSTHQAGDAQRFSVGVLF